jgi:hypothetical protein
VQRTRNKKSRSGNVILEFALVSLFAIPAVLGTVGVGLTLGNYIKILQTTRDTAHMFARGIDFDAVENRDIVVRLASTLNMTRNGGNGTVILSKIITPRTEDCEAANRANDCPNRDVPVVIHRIRIGNDALRTSRYGTPAPSIVSPEGNISPSDYLGDSSVRAPNLATELTNAGIVQQRGEIAYVVEAYFTLPALRFLRFAPNGAYCRFMF